MFAHLLRAPDSEANRPCNTVRLVCEQLEDRSVPALVMIAVNTVDDTSDVVGDNKAEDANGKVSLRAVIEFSNQKGNAQTGNYNINR